LIEGLNEANFTLKLAYHSSGNFIGYALTLTNHPRNMPGHFEATDMPIATIACPGEDGLNRNQNLATVPMSPST
jgi:hypothetical protein